VKSTELAAPALVSRQVAILVPCDRNKIVVTFFVCLKTNSV